MTDHGDPTEPVPDETATKREGQHARPARPEALARGAALGRYLVLDKIGEGGMGVVYAAFDPELDRKVAIKVLQGGEEGSSTGQAWLLREAQALARLQHPNVVAVHDVGTLNDDQIFVAMELVDGVTMRTWLKDQPRSWREVVPVMRAAGAGLAAAHQAGLVHRDFKPENVLVGKDGRVRVMDFGLARLHAVDDGSDPQVETRSPLTAELTLAGHVVGTPAYMAPELYRGQPADARSDQFAFGVTLFESLFRARPYARSELQKQRAAKPKIPPDTRVPAALHKVALQALALAPEQRFASMDALLAELGRDPLALRRRALFAGAGALALAGAIGGTMLLAGRHARRCEGLESRLDGTWDSAIKQRVRDGYLATKRPFAAQAYVDLERAMDGYAGEWVKVATDSCRATRVRGEQTEEVLTLRQGCLDQRLDGLGALARVAIEPTKALVDKGGTAVRELEPLADCSNVAALRDQGNPPSEADPGVAEVVKKLADTKANIIAGSYVAAGAAAIAASRKADEIHSPALKAQAELMRGLTLASSQSYDEAHDVLVAGTLAGLTGKRDDIAESGAMTLALVTAEGMGKPAEAKVWLAIAKAEGRRYGHAPSVEMRELEIEGVVEGRSGNVFAAVGAHEKAYTTARTQYGADNPIIWEDEQLYATSLSHALDFPNAVVHYEHALKLRESIVGPEHPDVALLLSNTGACYTRVRDPRGKTTLERALAIREKVFGKGHPALVPTLQNLDENLRVAGDPQALAVGERSVRIARLVPGVEHPMFHGAVTEYVQSLTRFGRYGDAHALLDEVVPLEKKTASVIRPDTEAAAADLALAEHAWADAAAHASEAVAEYQAAGGKDEPNAWWPLSLLGRAQLELGKSDEARASLEAAIAIGDRVHLHEAELAPAREALARLKK